MEMQSALMKIVPNAILFLCPSVSLSVSVFLCLCLSISLLCVCVGSVHQCIKTTCRWKGCHSNAPCHRFLFHFYRPVSILDGSSVTGQYRKNLPQRSSMKTASKAKSISSQ